MSALRQMATRLGLYFRYGFAFVTYFTLAYVIWVLLWGSGGYLEYSGLQTRLSDLLASNSAKVKRNREIKAEVQRFATADPAQIESYARTSLGLIDAEEQLIIFVEEGDAMDAGSEREEPAAGRE